MPKHHVFTFAIALVSAFIVGCDESSIPTKPSSENVHYGLYGATYTSPAVTVKDLQHSYWAQELVANFLVPRPQNAPAQFTPVQLHFSCDLPPASKQAHLVFVEIYGGSVNLPLYLVEPSRVEDVKNYMIQSRLPPNIVEMLKKAIVKKVDVIVNRTDKPVYLVLSAYDSTLWSLHLAEGVRLDGIAVIGHDAQALAHLPKNTPVAFVVSDDLQKKCNPTVQRPVNNTWTMLTKLDQKFVGDGFRKTLREAKDRYGRFHEWLSWRVGSPDEVISAYRTSHVLVGSKPVIPIPYHSLAGTDIIYTPSAKPIWGDKGDATKAMVAWLGW